MVRQVRDPSTQAQQEDQEDRAVPTLNAAGSPAQAAGIYVTDFERAGIPAYSRREAAAGRWPPPVVCNPRQPSAGLA